MTEAEYEKGLTACVHCGFCLPACPTYLETGDEADSPRGRIVLMRGVREGKIPLLPESATAPGGVGYHLDRCLGCRACEPACPSGVPYGALLEEFRDRQEKAVSRPLGERVLRDGLLAALTNPPLMKAALLGGKLVGGKIPAPIARFVGLPVDTQLPIPDSLSSASQKTPVFTPAQGERRGQVALLSGCVMRVLYSPVHLATVRVLAANGYDVLCPENQPCCGALHGHQGKMTDARHLARELVKSFSGTTGECDALILNSAGCGSFLKEYGHLIGTDTPAAVPFAAKTNDITEFLSRVGWRKMPHLLRKRVTYHDACHLAHGQRIKDAPRRLLQAIPGITFVECAESDVCCGSAGVYNYLQPEMAAQLQRRKVENLLAAQADIIATGNPGCLAWIQSGLPHGVPVPEIVHPIELLDRAYNGSTPG